MTATQIDLNKQERKTTKKKQAYRNMDIGTPLRPVRQRPKQQEHEVLNDWSHAS
ncbi:hypothetical protein QUB80_18700 [Chlorogloeopsis sp. ULAP01]|uniref:hypothetical protein n=1 Tax=Chlorogloeopsis sp. ULAP01 TaxID=3056483 RepID=UPI0025AA6BC1|nr:hypothetical protein [Chlorogloeopsis sp. ULAP01]MDM9382726.1 hypothetical protein [Chlorogloeopsis sp. ULAP01]